MPSKPYKAIKPMFKNHRWNIVRGDMVQILAGKDKGRQGRVLRVIRDERFPRVLVENCSIVKKHMKASAGGEKGFVVSMEAPIHYSNVALVDPVTGKPVRCQIKFLEDGSKVRVSKGKHASQSIIPKPTEMFKSNFENPQVGPKDTPLEEVLRVTHDPSNALPSFKLPHIRLRPQVRFYSSCAQPTPFPHTALTTLTPMASTSTSISTSTITSCHAWRLTAKGAPAAVPAPSLPHPHTPSHTSRSQDPASPTHPHRHTTGPASTRSCHGFGCVEETGGDAGAALAKYWGGVEAERKLAGSWGFATQGVWQEVRPSWYGGVTGVLGKLQGVLC